MYLLPTAGPKDLPVLARSAGLLTGRAAAYLSTARNRILGFAEENQITQACQSMSCLLVHAGWQRDPDKGDLSETELTLYSQVLMAHLLLFAAASGGSGEPAAAAEDSGRAAWRRRPLQSWVGLMKLSY